MRFWKYAMLGAVAALAVGACANREHLTRLSAVNSLFAEDKITRNFSHMDDLFHTAHIDIGPGPARALPYGPQMKLPPALMDWLTRRSATSLIVLHKGQIVSEQYFQGTGEDDLRISWSVAKSFLSALYGVLLEEGAIGSLEDPVTRYVPEMAGSAYDGATIRDVLQMSSGVAFNEDYFNFWSDINKMGRVLALNGSMDRFAIDQDKRAGPPGERFRYVSIDTHVLSLIARRATGRSLPDLLSEKIIQPLGFEKAPYYVTDGHGAAFALGGLNVTTRDYARFGQMILNDGRVGGQQVVPADWIALSTTPSAKTEPGHMKYGLHWWMPSDGQLGEVLARGVYGQEIYIDDRTQTVIVLTSSDRGFQDDGVSTEKTQVFRILANAAQEALP